MPPACQQTSGGDAGHHACQGSVIMTTLMGSSNFATPSLAAGSQSECQSKTPQAILGIDHSPTVLTSACRPRVSMRTMSERRSAELRRRTGGIAEERLLQFGKTPRAVANAAAFFFSSSAATPSSVRSACQMKPRASWYLDRLGNAGRRRSPHCSRSAALSASMAASVTARARRRCAPAWRDPRRRIVIDRLRRRA